MPYADGGGNFDGNTADRTSDRPAGTGGGIGTGGVIGGGGTGGGGACVRTGAETCDNLGIDNDCDGDSNDVDPGELLDPANCGACFQQCFAANAATFECAADLVTGLGSCKFTCAAGYKDTDGMATNGCECHVLSATEVCNSIDDNCDGRIDEGFDLMTDGVNCGKCGTRCNYPFATAACDMGACKMTGCITGFVDANGRADDGCECQKTNGGNEICDGVDNDCDGMIDEAAELVGRPPCKTRGVCAGIMATCRGTNGWSCVYGADYQDVEDNTKACDGKDNDCDGSTDEAFDIGKACVVGSGPCAGSGVWMCDTAGGRRCNGQMLPAQPEVCNGRDDDCDGKVDEIDSRADMTTDDKLIYFSGRNVTIFAYEASRYDATGTSTGFDSTRRPCAVGGRRPWTNITKEEAAAACARIGTGWRLCSRDEWQDACNGSGNTVFPYGNNYSTTACVGFDYTAPAANTEPTATGTATMCKSDIDAATTGDELYDMSGNVREWVLTTVTPASYELRGGAYDITSFDDTSVTPTVKRAPGLQCDSTTPAPSAAVRLPAVGFRCCRPGQLP